MSDWWNDLSVKLQKEYLKDHPNSKRKIKTSTSATGPKISAKKTAPNKNSLSLNEENSDENSEDSKSLEIKESKETEETTTENETETENENEELKPIDPSTKKKVLKYANSNSKNLSKLSKPTIDNMDRAFEDRMNRMPIRDKRRLGREIRNTLKLKDRGRIRKLTRKITLMTGITLIGATGLSLVTGMPITLGVEILAAGFANDIANIVARSENKKQDELNAKREKKFNKKSDKRDEKHQRDIEEELKREHKRRRAEALKRASDEDYIKAAGKAFTNKVRENMDKPEEIVKAAVKSDSPDVVIDDTPNEAASISINSNHETDLNKTLIKIEKLEVASQTESILNEAASVSAENSHKIVSKLINHVELIETAIPNIASIFVSALSQKMSLSNRAKCQLNLFNMELAKCRTMLTEYGNKNSSKIKKTPLSIILKKNIKSKEYKYEVSFVKCESNNIRLCELHTFSNVEAGSYPINRVEIYSYMDGSNLNVALSIDSNFTPKAFNTIKPREIATWLDNNGLISKKVS